MTLHWQDTQAEIHKVVVGPYDNNVFILRCRETGDAVLLDAANEHELLLELCRDLGVRRVLETHGHADHIQAVPQVRDAGYRVAVTADDAAMLPSYDDILLDDSVIEVGRLRLSTIHTPGHTPGSMCFLLEGSPILFSGDTLFPGGPGNTFGSDTAFDQIIEQIDRRLFTLPKETLVLPGHGEDTTIGTERPHLDEWIARRW
ncbi:MAG TPA: MBL fold metallo-hydrolase [Acidimicrobiales bacterium]|jgi:glyoxylase-like metal-dependent hydrolase (beta-lactamase superfamily II)